MAELSWTTVGKYRALIRPEFDSRDLRESLAALPDVLKGPGVKVLQAGRHITSRLALPAAGAAIDAVVKQFGRQSPAKDLWDRLHGSKARRTFAAADFLKAGGVGTIPPVACLERWAGIRLKESYFISAYMADTVCLKDRLAEIWRTSTDGADFAPLLKLVAEGIRDLHDAGCTHGDLGNQNIELVRDKDGDGFSSVAFLDLNRARFGKELSIADRAGDLARIALPDGLYDRFFSFYWRGDVPPEFVSAYRRLRALFKLHGKTRKFRHPFRELKYRRHPETAPAQAGYPLPYVTDGTLRDGHYTDASGRRLTPQEVAALPAGTSIYRFCEERR